MTRRSLKDELVMTQNAPGIMFKDVGKSFDGNVEVLTHLNLDIPADRFVAVLGPTGCGKTTMLRMAGGLDTPDEGEVVFSVPNPQIGFCFQEPRLLPWRNVERNVALPLELEGHVVEPEAIHDVLEMVGLSDATKRMPAALSGGMKMRTALARALISDPRLLLLDEPFGALDEVTRFKLDEDVARLVRGRDTTVLMVTHSITEAVFLADEVVVFSPRPAKVVDRFQINLGPRTPEMRVTSEFSNMTTKVYEALRSCMEEA